MSGIELQFATVLAPRWSEIAVKSTSNTAGVQNLDLIGPQTVGATEAGVKGVGARQRFVTLCAMGVDCWIVFADATGHADDVAAATAGVNQTTGGWPLTAGIPQSFYVANDYNWLGFITASGTGTLVIYISSGKA